MLVGALTSGLVALCFNLFMGVGPLSRAIHGVSLTHRNAAYVTDV